MGSASIDVTFQDCGQTSTSVARPTFTFVPTIPPVTFTPINPGTGTTTTTVAKPVVTLNPSIPSVTIRPTTTTTVARTTTTTTTTLPAVTFTAKAPPTNPGKVCVQKLDTTGSGTLYIQTSVALAALTAKSGVNNRTTSKSGPLAWTITVDRADVGKSLALTGTRATGGTATGTITVPKACGDQ